MKHISLPTLPSRAPGQDQPQSQSFSSPSQVDASQREQLARELANRIEGEVRFGLHDRMLYSTDASLYQVEPVGVVIPSSIEDAQRIVEWACERGVALLPRGGGTSLAGQCTNHAVVVDFSNRCTQFGEFDEINGTIRVEPGITVDDLNDAIVSSRWFYATDPATSRHANIGGCIGNNAAGARSVRYGRTSENVLGVDVVLTAPQYAGKRLRLEQGASDRSPQVRELTRSVCEVVAEYAGLIRERFPKTIRRNAGYGLDMILAAMTRGGWKEGQPITDQVLSHVNLAHLLCGSEGTLAVTLGAQLKLHPKPKSKGLAVLGFDSLDAAIEVVPALLTTGPTAIELLDDTVVDLARANTEYRSYVELMPTPRQGILKAVLYVEYFGANDEEIKGYFEALRRVAPDQACEFHTQANSMLNAWKLRKAGEPLLHGIPGNRKPITFVEDNAIPVENLAEFVKKLRDIVANHGTIAAYYAHASVGVLHVRPLLDIHDPQDRERMKAISIATADLAKSLGGVMSGEHGDGRIRGPLLERYFGSELMHAFRRIKEIFDPANLLNPGNIVEPREISTIAQRLRVEPERGRPVVVPPELDTYFDYSSQHGFDGAVEMCNGAGVCRKKQGGTMCPSYQATLDERHSTRGRGNALRLAITGQFAGHSNDSASQSQAGSIWNDPGTKETLNLCLSCKACKTECPSNVDISKLKAEYTAQGIREKGRVPFQVLVFGAIRHLNRLGSLTPKLSNWMGKTWLSKFAAKKLLNIDPRRSLPLFAKGLNRVWKNEAHQTPAPKVLFFGDCFSMFNEPGIGLATKEVFEAFGYRVELANAGCCGRAKISMGDLASAIDEVDATLSKLEKLIQDPDVKAVLVSEPSCLSAIKDDWLSLKVAAPMSLRVKLAGMSYMPEEFLEKLWQEHPYRPDLSALNTNQEVALHAHCHQKALWGAESSGALLRRLFGSKFKVLDTGCCGMAGSFGFTCDRYDVSEKIANLSLMPALKAAPQATIAATGTSCRHQIHDLSKREALHPMQIIQEALSSKR